jgi:hypothetical protein
MSRVLSCFVGSIGLLCSITSFGVAASLCSPMRLADDDDGLPGLGKKDCKSRDHPFVNGSSTCPCEK